MLKKTLKNSLKLPENLIKKNLKEKILNENFSFKKNSKNNENSLNNENNLKEEFFFLQEKLKKEKEFFQILEENLKAKLKLLEKNLKEKKELIIFLKEEIFSLKEKNSIIEEKFQEINESLKKEKVVCKTYQKEIKILIKEKKTLQLKLQKSFPVKNNNDFSSDKVILFEQFQKNIKDKYQEFLLKLYRFDYFSYIKITNKKKFYFFFCYKKVLQKMKGEILCQMKI